MATPEGKVKAWLRREVLKKYPTTWLFMAPSGPFGKKGTPDFLMCIGGLFVAVETKADETKDPTPMQTHQIKLLISANSVVCVMRGKDEELLRKLFEVIDKRILRLNSTI